MTVLVHTVLAMVPHGTSERVVGVFSQTPWVRQSAPREGDGRKHSTRQRRKRSRESEVWVRAVEQAGLPAPRQVWIHVADRYADMFALLHACRQTGTCFLVRAAQNRRALSESAEAEPELDHLLDRVKSWPAQGQGSVEVPSQHERRVRPTLPCSSCLLQISLP